VAATWFANTNRATNAPYSIDGGAPILVNQQKAPSGVSYSGAAWQVLNASYTAASSTLTVTLGNIANGFVIADAVMITCAPGPMPLVITSPPQATPNPAIIGAEVVLSVAASEAGASLSYAWDFGDGQSGSGQAVTHIYSAAGQYTATVTISDGHGKQAATSVKVQVER
jgi:PKD repeat protein